MVEILIGNIGCGKSTYAKQRAKDGAVIISKDSIRYAIGAGTYVFNCDYEKNIAQSIRLLFKLFCERNDVDIIVDETNMTTSIRQYYIDISKQYKIKCVAVMFPKISKEEAINRRLQNNHGNTSREIWVDIWERFNRIYEEPSLDEGFDIIIQGH